MPGFSSNADSADRTNTGAGLYRDGEAVYFSNAKNRSDVRTGEMHDFTAFKLNWNHPDIRDASQESQRIPLPCGFRTGVLDYREFVFSSLILTVPTLSTTGSSR